MNGVRTSRPQFSFPTTVEICGDVDVPAPTLSLHAYALPPSPLRCISSASRLPRAMPEPYPDLTRAMKRPSYMARVWSGYGPGDVILE